MTSEKQVAVTTVTRLPGSEKNISSRLLMYHPEYYRSVIHFLCTEKGSYGRMTSHRLVFNPFNPLFLSVSPPGESNRVHFSPICRWYRMGGTSKFTWGESCHSGWPRLPGGVGQQEPHKTQKGEILSPAPGQEESMQQQQLGMEGLGSSSGESPELVMSGEPSNLMCPATSGSVWTEA